MGYLSTAAKVRVAGVLFQLVRGARALAVRPRDRAICRRRGVRWDLDLRDGIPLGLYLGTFERTTARALRRLLPPGGVAIDIGANIGAHALPMARVTGAKGRVIAVEPTAAAFADLGRNIQLNPGLHGIVAALQAAVVAPEGRPPAEYYSAWPVTSGSTASPHQNSDDRHAIHRGVLRSTAGAIGITLDDLVSRESLVRLDVIKLDVDGGEVDVLKGGRAALARLRPAIVLELCPYALDERGASLADLLKLLEEANYRLVDERSFAPVASGAADLARRIPSGGSINVVALPREQERLTRA